MWISRHSVQACVGATLLFLLGSNLHAPRVSVRLIARSSRDLIILLREVLYAELEVVSQAGSLLGELGEFSLCLLLPLLVDGAVEDGVVEVADVVDISLECV